VEPELQDCHGPGPRKDQLHEDREGSVQERRGDHRIEGQLVGGPGIDFTKIHFGRKLVAKLSFSNFANIRLKTINMKFSDHSGLYS
jgi:hypothetical protein